MSRTGLTEEVFLDTELTRAPWRSYYCLAGINALAAIGRSPREDCFLISRGNRSAELPFQHPQGPQPDPELVQGDRFVNAEGVDLGLEANTHRKSASAV